MKKYLILSYFSIIVFALSACSGCNSGNKNPQSQSVNLDSTDLKSDSLINEIIDSNEINLKQDSNSSYCNKKYNYCLDLPNLKWVSTGESESGDGITYKYENKIELIIFAEPHANPLDDLKKSYQSSISQSAPGYRILNHNLAADNFRIEGEELDLKFLRFTKIIDKAHLSILLKFKPEEAKNAQRYLMILNGNIRKNKALS